MKKIQQIRSSQRALRRRRIELRLRKRRTVIRTLASTYRNKRLHNRPVRAAHLAMRSVPLQMRSYAADVIERALRRDTQFAPSSVYRFRKEAGPTPVF